MAMQAQCPKCKSVYVVRSEQSGRSATCPKCKSHFVIGKTPTVAIPEKQHRPTAISPTRKAWVAPFFAGAAFGGTSALLLSLAVWAVSVLPSKDNPAKKNDQAKTATAKSADDDINAVLQHVFWDASVTEKEVKAILSEMGGRSSGILVIGRSGRCVWVPDHIPHYAHKDVAAMNGEYVMINVTRSPIGLRSDKRLACILLKDAISYPTFKELNPGQ